MKDEITKIDMSKYIVLKREDLSWLSERERDTFFETIEKIDNSRKRSGKPQNEYLVLNFADSFSIRYLFEKMALLNEKTRFNQKWRDLKVKDIAVDIVNAILTSK